MDANPAYRSMVEGFKPIFNRAKATLELSSPHARNAALLPFLLHVYSSESGHLHVLASDFHANTWHALFNCDQLHQLKETLGFNESFSAFVQFFYKAFTSDSVKIELGGPASAIGGKGATSAKIKASGSLFGTSRDVCFHLELFKGRSANDAVGALALDLFEAFDKALLLDYLSQENQMQSNHQMAELELLLEQEKLYADMMSDEH